MQLQRSHTRTCTVSVYRREVATPGSIDTRALLSGALLEWNCGGLWAGHPHSNSCAVLASLVSCT
eukprot:1347388-Alexandrium_andersonii.AAC.1